MLSRRLSLFLFLSICLFVIPLSQAAIPTETSLAVTPSGALAAQHIPNPEHSQETPRKSLSDQAKIQGSFADFELFTPINSGYLGIARFENRTFWIFSWPSLASQSSRSKLVSSPAKLV